VSKIALSLDSFFIKPLPHDDTDSLSTRLRIAFTLDDDVECRRV